MLKHGMTMVMKTIRRCQGGRTQEKKSGFNFRMNELQACVGLAQLKKLEKILLNHRKNYNLIFNRIKIRS